MHCESYFRHRISLTVLTPFEFVVVVRFVVDKIRWFPSSTRLAAESTGLKPRTVLDRLAVPVISPHAFIKALLERIDFHFDLVGNVQAFPTEALDSGIVDVSV